LDFTRIYVTGSFSTPDDIDIAACAECGERVF
jgi:hypothetical protein